MYKQTFSTFLISAGSTSLGMSLELHCVLQSSPAPPTMCCAEPWRMPSSLEMQEALLARAYTTSCY